ncbi:MAG: hypothetical protein QME94_11630 [Anaerolineae bacterium]|nr:hypothetical protein [Anaerolineae bacterium]
MVTLGLKEILDQHSWVVQAHPETLPTPGYGFGQPGLTVLLTSCDLLLGQRQQVAVGTLVCLGRILANLW